jgi:DNA end-binding protein Ku
LRSAADVFEQVPATKISKEALDLAKHIIRTKRRAFDPAAVHDRYEAALAELVKAKIEGKPIRVARTRAPATRQTLLAALRESAGALAKTASPHANSASARHRPGRAKPPQRRKAG